MPKRQEMEGTKEDFTGHPLDDETWLHYAGARYYSAAFGRWTTTEPLLQSKSPKKLLKEKRRLLMMTSYNYSFDNPATLTDPTGLAPTDWYRDGNGTIRYSASVQSQADLEEGQTYLGENVLDKSGDVPIQLLTEGGDRVNVFDEGMTEGEAGAKGASGASVAATGQGGVLSLTEKGGKALSRLKVSTKAFGYVGTLAAFGLSSGSEGMEFLDGDDRFGVYERVKVGTDAFITVGEVSLTAFGGPLGGVIGATGSFAAQTTGLKSWADRQITLQILEARVDEVVE